MNTRHRTLGVQLSLYLLALGGGEDLNLLHAWASLYCRGLAMYQYSAFIIACIPYIIPSQLLKICLVPLLLHILVGPASVVA